MQKHVRIFFLAIFVGITQLNFCQTVTNVLHGDEQELESNYHFQLKKDKEAVDRALNGWWQESMKTHDQRVAWFKKAKFGCFVHWGVYSGPAGIWKGKDVMGYAEHLMRKEKIPLEEYKREVVAPFNPVKFSADEWMKRVKETGMKYFIITAKHHDGFAMFFSDVYPYDMRLTKFDRDPMLELRNAAKKYGIKFGFYYSHAFDWENPDAPGNDWYYNNPGGDKLLFGKDWWLKDTAFISKADKYVNEKAIPQIKELIRKYNPDILWFDTPHKLPLFENIKILKSIREIAPNIVVNGRLARFDDFNFGDYINTGDRAAHFHHVKGLWESIPTTNESYGYSKVDKYHKPSGYFIRLLASAASKGGNILLNVGPMGNGQWDPADVKIFEGIGKWMKVNSESIYGTEPSPFPVQAWGVITKKENNLYLHVFKWPKDGKLILGGLISEVNNAYLLSDETKKELPLQRINHYDLQMTIPDKSPDTINTVIVLNTKNKIQVDSIRLLSASMENHLMVFDSKIHGEDLSYGDGKVNREYITGWKNKDQWISWDCRVDMPIEFQLGLNFNTADKNDSGKVYIVIDDKSIPVNYQPVPTGSRRVKAGSIKLATGKHEIKLVAGTYTGKEFIRPLSIVLTPLGI